MGMRRHKRTKQLPTTDPLSVQSLTSAKDRRYRLIAQLESAVGVATDEDGAWPGEISVTWPQRSGSDFGFETGKAPPPLRRDVVVTFDHRMPLRSVYGFLLRRWPTLRKRGVVRATRPLGARTLALIQHVCIAMPRASWAERLEAWNAGHKQWHIEPRQAFIAEFHVAERSLTGTRHGLAYWYEPRARLTTEQLVQLARDGDAAAKRVLDRRTDTLERVGISVVLEPPITSTRRRARARSKKEKGEKQHGKTRTR